MTRLANPLPIFLDARGALLDGGSIYIGRPGTDPFVPGNRLPLFWDAARTIPAAQPLRTLGGVIVNAGKPSFVHLAESDYSFRSADADGLTVLSIASIAEADAQYQPLNSGLSALSLVQTQPFGRNLLGVADAAGLRTTAGLGNSALLAKATAAEYRANTANKVLTTDQIWAAAADLLLTVSGTTISVDLSQAFNFTLIMSGGPWTLAAPINGKRFQSGTIEIAQDATGGRVLNFNPAWRFAGGVVPALSTTPGALDVLSYRVLSGGQIFCSLAKAV